ncbi:MAG TPA: bacillithiol biosynthesis deacetylase BshB1 [Candidatus Acidoferrales bacterium]|nr:bacillithiol biosynthesis deacetylase BshB1 [Candidatus Acidoferrales bacterium]
MKLDLLAIAAHPDDVELTCGGTLIKMSQLGYKTGVLDLTHGEMGTRGTPEIRLQEAQRAGEIMGVAVRANLSLPDARLEVSEKYKLAVAAKIREWQPHTVILPYWEGRHPDHYNAAKLSYEGCFLAGLKQLSIPGEAFRPFKILYSTTYDETVRPSFAVDITAQFERRHEAILAYESQFRPKKRDDSSKVHIPLDELEDRVNLTSRHYGRMIGVKYAEPFLVREILQVDDVVKMPVRSI